jgi:hypothetical protein
MQVPGPSRKKIDTVRSREQERYSNSQNDSKNDSKRRLGRRTKQERERRKPGCFGRQER